MGHHYCTLWLRADSADAAQAVFLPQVQDELEFEDHESPRLVKQAQRFREMGLIPRSDLPRYAWRLQSSQGVDTEEFDPMAHVSWLLAQVRPGVCLGQLPGMETLLSFFWGGPGRGGGPFVSTELAALLVQQHIALDFGFYVQSDA